MAGAKCRVCGESITWAKLKGSTARIPLTYTSEVYILDYPGPKDSFEVKKTKKQVYVNHRLVCGASFREGYGR